ncbi:TetR/AcrR family transcriptional regulator [Saccharopolyspora griseoalba]|uniref:TetR/AcrR family transcriptional regulator n=1 Tax=Saccharopolyspora griseoalba TaxID=1431848 RepID=A0ABW2LKN4_9PSEU
MTRPNARADRILDAAGELMIKLGHRKVTIEDVARRAEVGKGTVYLHWPNKEQLFEALVLRESLQLVAELTAALRADPQVIRPHRFYRMVFLATRRSPLLHALVTDDTELLGNIKRSARATETAHVAEAYQRLLLDHDLLRDDVPHAFAALTATTTGFFLADQINPEYAGLDDEAKADALADTIRRAFEPDVDPDHEELTAAVNRLAELYDDLTARFREWIYPPHR